MSPSLVDAWQILAGITRPLSEKFLLALYPEPFFLGTIGAAPLTFRNRNFMPTNDGADIDMAQKSPFSHWEFAHNPCEYFAYNAAHPSRRMNTKACHEGEIDGDGFAAQALVFGHWLGRGHQSCRFNSVRLYPLHQSQTYHAGDRQRDRMNPVVKMPMQKLKAAFDRLGCRVGTAEFAQVMKRQFGDEAVDAILRFFDGKDDIPLGLMLQLCESAGVPASHILDDQSRAYLQIFDYLGGNPAYLRFPSGFLFSHCQLDSPLFYMPVEKTSAPDQLCAGIWPGDLLIMSRVTAGPQPDDVFMLESDNACVFRICIEAKAGMHRFTASRDSETEGLITIPLGRQVSEDEALGRPALVGRLVWQIHTSPAA